METLKSHTKKVDVNELQKQMQIEMGFSKHIDCDNNEPVYSLWIKSEKAHFIRTYALGDCGNAICDFLGQGHKLHTRTFDRLLEGITNEDFESHVKECVHTRLGWGELKEQDIFKYTKAFIKEETGLGEVSTYKGNLDIVRGTVRPIISSSQFYTKSNYT